MTETLPEREVFTGCKECLGAADAAAAWVSLRRDVVGVVVEESHYSVRVTACACGQRFGVVFAERIDWTGGQDDQTWLAVPLSHAECAQVLAEGDSALARAARNRRFLLRIYPETGGLQAAWRDGGFALPMHD